MTSREFCYWLQGYFELGGADPALTAQQSRCIRQHLALVFKYEIDPSQGPPEKQAELQKIHDGVEPAFDYQPQPDISNVLIRC